VQKTSPLLILAALMMSSSALAQDECPTLDFDQDAYGNEIQAGQDLSEAYGAWGIHLTVWNTQDMSSTGLGIAFDSSNPSGGDYDLGTPNESYGGPGIGSGGESNDTALGNLLISAENFIDADGDGLIDDPDDDVNGAWFDWTFDTPVCVLGVDLIDVETGEAPSDFVFYDQDGGVIDWIQGGGLGNNSYERLEFEVCGVYHAMFDIYGSSAVDNVVICPPAEVCVEEAVPDSSWYGGSGGHAIWLPGISTDLIFDPDSGSFLEFADGTALLTGTVYDDDAPSKGFSVEVAFSGRTESAPTGSPKLELSSGAYAPSGPIDPDTWAYYTDFGGTLTGVGDWAGAVVEVTPRGAAFQLGDGASGKNTNFGGSGWLDYVVSQQPDNDTHELPDDGHGDFNFDFNDCDGTPEECDGIDNDGDGGVDEGFSDIDGDGTADCVDIESCDGVDNDGDGDVDEGYDSDYDDTADCFDTEECDGYDNDGDGSVDEGFDSDYDGTADCFDDEECDGVDNDGDGATDEGYDADGDGTADCFDVEECDGVDNDGDGSVDEGFDVDNDGTPDCSDTEECDGQDNDGDGAVDEGFDADGDGVGDCLDEEECDGVDNDGDGSVDEGYDVDGDGTADCFDTEECDGQDNDGDCDIDEGLPDCDICPDPQVEDLGVASGYNLFVLGDYTASTDIQGKAVVCGSANLDSFSIGQHDPGGDVLVARYHLGLNNGSVYGDAAYGSSYYANNTTYLGGAPRQDTPVDCDAAETELEAASASIAALPANGVTVVQSWGGVELTGTDSLLSVFDLTCDALGAASSVSITAAAGSTVVVNVTGADCDISNMGMTLSGPTSTEVLFNFPDATSLNISGVGVLGSVLAPNADATFSNGNLDGTLVVASLSGNGELHHFPFDGPILSCPEDEEPTGSCEVEYSVLNSWPSGGGEGFQASVNVIWYGDPIESWNLGWSFSGDESISSGWNGNFSQSGADVSVTDSGWNGALNDGDGFSVGFNAERSEAGADPTTFMVNGVECNDPGDPGDGGGDDTGDPGGDDTGPIFEF